MYRNSHKIKISLLFLIISSQIISQNKKEIINDLNLNIGITGFKNYFRDLKQNDNMAFVAKAATLGLEFYNEDLKISIEAKKSFWLGISASSFLTTLMGGQVILI